MVFQNSFDSLQKWSNSSTRSTPRSEATHLRVLQGLYKLTNRNGRLKRRRIIGPADLKPIVHHGKGKKKMNKKLKTVARAKNPTLKMKKLYKKRVEAYNSDEEDEEEEPMSEEDEEEEERRDLEVEREIRRSDEDDDEEDEEEEEKDGAHMGFTKFNEGCRAFKVAFLTIMKKRLPNDPLGPILSAHKKLVAEKLAEEETEHKVKGEAKKEKHLAGEKGHVKPSNFLDSKEKSLISIATKGVVKLFNAVNKAQNPQRGLNPSRSKDAKELAKRRKQTFLSELKKSTMEAPGGPSSFNSSKIALQHPGWCTSMDKKMDVLLSDGTLDFVTIAWIHMLMMGVHSQEQS